MPRRFAAAALGDESHSGEHVTTPKLPISVGNPSPFAKPPDAINQARVVAVSITQTPSCGCLTYKRVPTLFTATANGPPLTEVVASTAWLLVLMTDTSLLSEFVTTRECLSDSPLHR